MRYHLHTIKIHLIVQFNNLSKFTELCNHHHRPGLENSLTPKAALCSFSIIPYFHTQLQATINLLSYSIGLTFLGGKIYSKNEYNYVLKNILGKCRLNFIFLILLPRIPNIWTFMRSSPAYIPRKEKVYKHAKCCKSLASFVFA